MKPSIILIDNYDSFAHNLARYAQLAGAHVTIIRNDALKPATIKRKKPDGIILSPGPKAPQDAGISIDLIKQCYKTIPILGICLGHQAIGEAFGGTTIQTEPHHGRASKITHTGDDPLFKNIPSPFGAGRYHSLLADITNAQDLKPIAHYGNLTMAIKHKTRSTYGIQFHPESILTPDGQTLINNFIDIVKTS